jgi:hypothetical protein
MPNPALDWLRTLYPPEFHEVDIECYEWRCNQWTIRVSLEYEVYVYYVVRVNHVIQFGNGAKEESPNALEVAKEKAMRQFYRIVMDAGL